MSAAGSVDVVQIESRVREMLAVDGRIPVQGLGTHEDLYARGLTSHGSVDLMLALEDEFEVQFPDEMLRRTTFSSVSAITQALSTLVS